MATVTKRKGKGGTVSYQVKIRLKGHPPQTASFQRLTDARVWGQTVEADMREHRHFPKRQARKHTLNDAITRYVETVLPQKKSAADQLRHLEFWRERFGYLPLADVTPALIAEERDRLARGTTYRGTQRAPGTVVHYLVSLSHVFTVAAREWGWAESNPVLQVSKPKQPKGRIRYLSDQEREALLTACEKSENPYLQTAVVLALSTGCRKSELMWLEWKNVDLSAGRAVLHETKNEQVRTIPITGLALDLLRMLYGERMIGTDLVFPGKNPHRPFDLRKCWEAVLREAEIEDFRWHDLRHSCAGNLAMAGYSLTEIGALLGHKTAQMTLKYAHLSPASTAKMVETMNEKLFR